MSRSDRRSESGCWRDRPTNRRPRESTAIACGTLNSPGPDPVLPHVIRNFPSFDHLLTRLTGPPITCPSVTKMSPVAVVTTSVGSRSGSRRVMSTVPFASYLVTWCALAVAALRVAHPDVPLRVHVKPVRKHVRADAPAPQHVARRIEREDRRLRSVQRTNSRNSDGRRRSCRRDRARRR